MISAQLGSALARTGLSRRGLMWAALALLIVGSIGLYLLFQWFPQPKATVKLVIRNDGTETIVLEHCANGTGSGRCNTSDQSQMLGPGLSFVTLAEVPGENPYLLHTPKGLLIGCLPISLTAGEQGTVTVLASQAQDCGSLIE